MSRARCSFVIGYYYCCGRVYLGSCRNFARLRSWGVSIRILSVFATRIPFIGLECWLEQGSAL